LAQVSVVSLVDPLKDVRITRSITHEAPSLTTHAVLHWRWNFWIQLIFNGGAQAIHFFMPESRATIILDKEAKRRRKTGEDPNIYGPNELKTPRISLKEFGTIWMRPWIMLATEPIVLSLSLLSGFSDALIFTFLESFKPVYEQWGFGTLAIAWAFIPINLAYFIGYFSYYPWFWRDASHRKKNGRNSMNPERRLKWLLWTAPLEPIGTLTLQRQDFSDTLLT
jgi:hypothetical protein